MKKRKPCMAHLHEAKPGRYVIVQGKFRRGQARPKLTLCGLVVTLTPGVKGKAIRDQDYCLRCSETWAYATTRGTVKERQAAAAKQLKFVRECRQWENERWAI